MPFFAMAGHRLTQTNWTYRGNTVPLADKSQVFRQLKELQAAKSTNLAVLNFCPSGGVLNAEFRYAVAPGGGPRYVEYTCFNDDKTPAFLLNAVIGFPLAEDRLKGIVLIRFAGAEMHASCLFRGHDAVLSVDVEAGKLEVQWSEGQRRRDLDSGRVIGFNGSEQNELYSIRGQSREQELGGKAIKHELFQGSHSLGIIYPDGSWRGGPKTFVDRWFLNKIAILEYNAELPLILGQFGSLSWNAFFVALSGALTLPRPLSPFFNS